MNEFFIICWFRSVERWCPYDTLSNSLPYFWARIYIFAGKKEMKTESAGELMRSKSEFCESTAIALRLVNSEHPRAERTNTIGIIKSTKNWMIIETRPKRNDGVAVCSKCAVRACVTTAAHQYGCSCVRCLRVRICVCMCVNECTWARECAYLIRSGRRSKTFGCGCFNVFKGDNTTLHANINSVDSSMGCEGVLSSGVWRSNDNSNNINTHDKKNRKERK